MSVSMHVPERFAHLTELANEGTGGFAMHATNEFFAEQDNLLRVTEPIFVEDKYTSRGKWMDGWESSRRRTPGHDACVVRLGLPGEIHGVTVDTTHFKGNAPQHFSLEGLHAPGASLERVLEHPGWTPVVPQTPLKPDFRNLVDVAAGQRVTHLRLRIFPDGGVARLRVWGRVLPEARTFWGPGSVDLVAVENGGTVLEVSDRFFGPPSNLLLPGRGVNMGDGWETARRRTPGGDWCVLGLGRPGVVERMELDTHFFKGNAPQAFMLEACHPDGTWQTLLGKAPLQPHQRHTFFPDRHAVVTQVRAHIFPHGGVNRMRLWGRAVETAQEAQRLSVLNGLSASGAQELLLSFNGAHAWGARLLALRPFAQVKDLFLAAQQAWWSLGEPDRLQAFLAHPRLGQKSGAPAQNTQSAQWSAAEQVGAVQALAQVAQRLDALNEEYFQKHGFIFIAFASGKTAGEMLAALEERWGNDRAVELENATVEQHRITTRRIEQWLLEA